MFEMVIMVMGGRRQAEVMRMGQVGQVGTSSWGGLANIPRRVLPKDCLDSQERQEDGEQGLGMLEEEGDPETEAAMGRQAPLEMGRLAVLQMCAPFSGSQVQGHAGP